MNRFLYSLIILLFVQVGLFAQADSLGIEREGDKVFVLHKVQSKQTLYSLARRYKTTVTAINAENPMLQSGLQVGQTLKIPYGGELKPEAPEVQMTTLVKRHKVAAGETLFSIARDYEVSVTDLKAWNNLETNAISLDQVLIINKEVPSGERTIDDITTEYPEMAEETSAQEVEKVEYEGTPFQQYEVEGVAEVIEEEEPSSKFFALHRTAKVGTVIKVRNLMNDLTVYVRVVGSIPETTNNEGIMIKLNQRAYENLKAIDKRFRVHLSYFQ